MNFKFEQMTDLASVKVGGKALAANDEFFAPKENLLKPEPAVFLEHKYTSRGKWMDGWETRRRRTPGHDWCVIRLGLRGVVQGVDIDTSHFLGNYPSEASLDAADFAGKSLKLLLKTDLLWTEILPRTPLKGGTHNLLAVKSLRPWTHLRLNIHPDGGVARLRAYGDVIPDWTRLKRSRAAVDLAAVENGGMVLESSDMFFGKAANLLMPGRPKNMGEGWETKRRRGPGEDWCLIKLGAPGIIERIEVDTCHFKGNYPESCSLEGCFSPDAPASELRASDTVFAKILPPARLKPHRRQIFRKELKRETVSHVRFVIKPDGGVARLRLYGRLIKT